MVSAAEGLTPDKAIERLRNFEGMVDPLVTPKDLQDLFSKVIYVQETIATDGIGLNAQKAPVSIGWFRVNEAKQSKETTEAILGEMTSVLKTARRKVDPSPEDTALLDQIDRQIGSVRGLEEGDAAAQLSGDSGSVGRSEPQTQASPVKILEVTALMSELQTKKVPLTPSALEPRNLMIALAIMFLPLAAPFVGFALGCPEAGVSGLGLLAMTIVLPIFAGPIGLGLSLGIVGLCAVSGIAVFVGMAINFTVKNSMLKKTTTQEQLLKRFDWMTATARARAMVKLGPEFRRALKSTFASAGRLCDYIDTLTDPKIPNEQKEEYRQRVKPKLEEFSEFAPLQEVLKEEGIVIPEAEQSASH